MSKSKAECAPSGWSWFGAGVSSAPPVPLLVTVPHSGEWVPPEADWLESVPPPVLLTDIDRFVDQLYTPALEKNAVAALAAQVHRYAVDLNRYPGDVDKDSVTGVGTASGTFKTGFHWVQTTQGVRLMSAPISAEIHCNLVQLYHDPFHLAIDARIQHLKETFPDSPIYHLDLHSMPSVGTGAHVDQGKARADIVLSDCTGKSASSDFRDLVWDALKSAGFAVAYNDPYKGGRITQRYGQPSQGHETLQIELNRALYMDETTKEKLPAFPQLQARLTQIIDQILGSLLKRQSLKRQ